VFNLISASTWIFQLLDLCLQMHLQTRSILASKRIFEFNSISACKCVSKLARLRPPSTSPSSHDHGLQVYLYVLAIQGLKVSPRLCPSTVCRCFQEHLRMLLQSLRALCYAPGGPGSIWNHLGAPVRSAGTSGRFVCGFRTDLHFADVIVKSHVHRLDSHLGIYVSLYLCVCIATLRDTIYRNWLQEVFGSN
jgi:hypothetical protein